jgi:iron complex outermembrane receptor protein
MVHDAETDEAVAGATAHLVEAGQYDVADETGAIEIEDVPYGEWRVEITRLGYRDATLDLEVDERERCYVVHLVPTAHQTGEVVVTDARVLSFSEREARFRSELAGAKLDRRMGATLAATLKNEAGFAMRSMGPAPARPVVRGLGGSRVVFAEDGVRIVDLSASSPDHATTVEPFVAERIEAKRGPKTLLHTTTAFGGVVDVKRGDLPVVKPERVGFEAGGYGESANLGGLYAAKVRAPAGAFAFTGEFAERRTGDLRTPEGTLDNSSIRTLDYAVGAGVFGERWRAGGSVREFRSDYGVPGGFVGAHPNGVDIEMFRRSYRAETEYRPSAAFVERATATFDRTYYTHTEFEKSGAVGAEFVARAYKGKASLTHRPLGALREGELLVSYEFRDLQMGGYVFTPPTTERRFAVALFEAVPLEGSSFQFGARYEYASATPKTGNPSSRIGWIRERDFHLFSASVTGVRELSDETFVGINLARSTRAPTPEELYSEGPHLAAYSYEVGDPDLPRERGFGGETFGGVETDEFKATVAAFWYEYDAHIAPRNTGEFNYQQLLPIYASAAAPARLTGGEASARWRPTAYFEAATHLDYTRGELIDEESPLPAIPPLKGRVEIATDVGAASFGASVDWAAEQRRVDRFEEPTAGYVVVNGHARYVREVGGATVALTFSADNLLDQPYRNHLSRVKSISPEPGRNFRLVLRAFY